MIGYVVIGCGLLSAQGFAPPGEIVAPGATRADWEKRVRPGLEATWVRALGRLEPAAADRPWLGDIRKPREIKREELPGYTRIELELPVETDYWSPHVLLIPKGMKAGERRPAVVAWTSTTPDWREPEKWWGAWLAERGYVVLTGWSFIRGYRGSAKYDSKVHEVLYERFGHWAPLARMAFDARREHAYLASLPYVDAKRVGFMGFSLSAKAALYVAGFTKEFAAVVSVDPFIPLGELPEGGKTNYKMPWYLDWEKAVGDTTVGGILAGHDHHEVLALAAPRPLMVIAGSGDTAYGRAHSDGRASAEWVEQARAVYKLYEAEGRLEFVATPDGHHANGPNTDAAWRRFVERWVGGRR
ncbi:MAG: prolyl oligopeptidase family serine peptidase [Acidobacteria bacterium]|nr:prolyl oligopeptidase family serine peptidase [Acidobacteriota bacterium]